MSDDFTLAFILTIIIIIVKFTIAGFLARNIIKRTKEIGKLEFNFLFAVLLFLLGLAVSRLLYFIFDFYMTNFDPKQFFVAPNVYVWQTATFIAGFTGSSVLYVFERDVFKFKLKRIPTIIVIIVAFIQLLYPINTMGDFIFVSSIGIIGSITVSIVPITLLYLAHKSTGQIRKVCLILSIVVIIYALIGNLMSEQLLAAIDAAIPGARLFIIILVPILKVICLVFLAYGALNFQI
jgi:hypothetical protein